MGSDNHTYEAICIYSAIITPKTLHPLTDEQQRDVDEFLKEELKPRRVAGHSVQASKAVRVEFDVE